MRSPLRGPRGGPPGQAELKAAIAAAKAESFDEAIAQCRAAVAANPRLEQAYLLWGSSASQKGDVAGELVAYDEGLGVLPRSKELLSARGLAKLGSGDGAGGIQDLEAARSVAGDEDSDLLADLAYAYVQTGEREKGESLARELYEKDTDCAQCAMAYGEILASRRAFRAAADAFARATQLRPDDPLAKQSWAFAEFSDGRRERAAQLFEELVNGFPEEPMLRIEFAKVLNKLGQHGRAAQQVEVVIKDNPDSVGLLKFLLQIQEAGNDKKGARRTRAKLKELRP